MALKDSYLSLITSQHRDKPKFAATMSCLLQYSEDIFETAIYLDDNFDIDLATGTQQDIIGEMIGQSRTIDLGSEAEVLSDEEYRVLQKIKIIKNLWNGKIEDLYEKWQNLLGTSILIKDNQDMTLSVSMDVEHNNPMKSLVSLIGKGLVIPKPMSVGIKYNMQYKGNTVNHKFGLGIARSGTKKIKTALPEKCVVTHRAGGAVVMSGQQQIKTRLPTKHNIGMSVGGMITMSGRMTIGARLEEM